MITEFSIQTDDGVTQLHGDLRLLEGEKSQAGVLLMVPGGWFAERDGFLGDSYTDADLMFLRIARRVHEMGFIVARYDNRGVTGNEFTIGLKKESFDPQADTKRYFEECVNSEIRKSVTPETLASDAAAVYRFLLEHSAVDPENVVIFAHSEGGIHISRLVGNEQISPKGIIFAGVTSGSPSGAVRWQMVDRYVDELMRWDRDGDGQIQSNDIEECYANSFFAEVGIDENEFHDQSGVWTESFAKKFFEAKYEKEKVAVLDCPDEMPFPKSDERTLDYVAASYRWLKTFFCDETLMISLLAKYSGQVAYHFGEIDRQIPFAAEVDNIEANASSMACLPKIVVHHQRGHAFASGKAVNGPMDAEAENIFVNEVIGMLRST